MSASCCNHHDHPNAGKVEKVLAYITRGDELLVFEHAGNPDAGIQVPAGTVEPGESLEKAVLREVQEETGLDITDQPRSLGRFEWFRKDRNEIHGRNVFHFEIETDEEEWLHAVDGKGEDQELVFQFYWLPIAKVAPILAADQGAYLHLI